MKTCWPPMLRSYHPNDPTLAKSWNRHCLCVPRTFGGGGQGRTNLESHWFKVSQNVFNAFQIIWTKISKVSKARHFWISCCIVIRAGIGWRFRPEVYKRDGLNSLRYTLIGYEERLLYTKLVVNLTLMIQWHQPHRWHRLHGCHRQCHLFFKVKVV